MTDDTRADQRAALWLYAGLNLAMALTWLALFTYLQRHEQLLAAGISTGFFRAERTRAVGGIMASVVPALVGIVSPVAALAILVLTPVFYAFTAEGLPENARADGGRQAAWATPPAASPPAAVSGRLMGCSSKRDQNSPSVRRSASLKRRRTSR